MHANSRHRLWKLADLEAWEESRTIEGETNAPNVKAPAEVLQDQGEGAQETFKKMHQRSYPKTPQT
jgi:hypothetical protein